MPRTIAHFRWLALVAAVCCGGQFGCVRVLAIGTKIIHGDPKTVSTIEQRTQVELQTGELRVAVLVDAPHQVQDRYERLVPDVQSELLRLMRRHGVQVVDPSEVDEAIESAGGVFSPSALAQAVDADYVIHAEIREFSDTEPGSDRLLQCRASGLVRGYEARGESGTDDRQLVERYEEPFLTIHPKGHPLTADQTTQRTFFQECTRAVAAAIGQQTYDVLTSELY